MSYSTPTDSEIISATRMLNQGPPNTGKSGSFQTWPKPSQVQVYPGEKGWATFPRGIEGFKAHLWSDDPVNKLSSHDVVQQVEQLTWEILGEKNGPITRFMGDGQK